MRERLCLLWLALCLACQGPRAAAAEKWADPALKVVDGLQVWLDATRQNAARQAHGKEALADQLLDICYDASGHGRYLSQKDPDARPIFLSGAGRPALRFPGERQHLLATGLKQAYPQVTVFVVAAPFSNTGDFRAFLALNATGKNDYVSGLTLDQGGGATARFESINPEGAGFGGAVNLLDLPLDFGTFYRLCVTTTPGRAGTKLFVDGKLRGRRDRTDSVLAMDQLTVGARYYTNGGLPQVRGFLAGDIAEVLIYDRVLTDAERAAVDRYLTDKHGDRRKVDVPWQAEPGKPLITVSDPPPVQMLVPGFTVRELPVKLTNINNVRYRADGKLVALAYDGTVYLLSDTDGDGLEDRADLFWDNQGRLRAPIGMALTPPGYQHGNGVFVASKGKCSLLVDTDGKGKADKEIVVASGWKEILPASHGVDALGVALDPKDGSVYFGLGTADYTDAYQKGKDGKAHYSLASERGTILRVAPDFKSREIIATGIRFPVGLAFNRLGDLFCTDQEGATWLPNGNPFDELLHVQKGRHYGFPPRHPRHLPGVIDQPSVFDYGPQHQSTCGLAFNEPVNGGPVFGPAGWRGDALITGYSRGKLYRTQLVKSAGGYVARNHLLACLNMLAVDACVSPRGDLVVAVHGGGPDWGSGPTGKGKLYKIVWTGQELAQPVAAWAQGPREVRVAFDRPIEAEHLRLLASRALIEYGAYVSPGDRFETLRPGYQAVQVQLSAPRRELPVLSVQVTADRRTLIIATPPHPTATHYALTLPGLGRPPKAEMRKPELPQVPETDLHYDLCGVEAVWQDGKGQTKWSGWLPHPSLDVARKLTAGSVGHEELWSLVTQPGRLTLRTRLNLFHVLRPAVQPGAQIDYEWPAEQVTLVCRARTELTVKAAAGAVPVVKEKDGGFTASVTVTPTADKLEVLELTLPTGGEPQLQIIYHTNEDPRPRALPLHRLLLPWVPLKKEETPAVLARDVPELKGGSWERGRKAFFGTTGFCSRCHRIHGEGSPLGPDLSNLPQRDYVSVRRDIVDPNFAINPDYITQLVEMKDGRVLVGALRTEGEKLHISDANARVWTVARDAVETITTSPKSLMPEGLDKQLGPDGMRDLLVFLLTDPPRMPDYGKGEPPPPRSRKEVQAVLAGAPDPPAKTRPIHVVLVAGRKDHGPGEHDYPAWLKVWKQLLELAADTNVTTAQDWPTATDLKSADVLVFYQQGKWTKERASDIDAFLARGGGLVYIHYAVDGGADAPGFAQRIGLAWQGGKSRFRHGPLDLGFETGTNHPIGRNFDKVHFHDESYWQLVGDPKKIKLLASGVEDGKAQPLFWTLEPDKGRVVVSIPGHYAWTFDDPLFRILLLRGIAWAAREPVDRFNELSTTGARIKE